MKMAAIHSLLSEKHSGEWGAEAVEGSPSSVCIVRAANFNNDGTLDFENIVKREIDSRKISKKQLKDGDLLLEKSGGSPTQPVGRVIYFVQSNDDIFLSNNFTTLLRPNRALVFPAYLFHALFTNHAKGNTVKYQNKTTGIINLKLDEYLESEIPIPPLDEQRRIATILDKADAICRKRQESLKLADAFVKSVFLDMFGDPVLNPKGWEKLSVKNVVQSIEAGWSADGESRPKKHNEKAVLKVSAVTQGYFKPEEHKALDTSVDIKKYVYPQAGDLLFSRANTKELVGATCVIYKNYPDFLLPDKLWRVRFTEMTNVFYMKFVLSSVSLRDQMTSVATGTSGSMYNISIEKFNNLRFNLPPLPLQNRFAEIVQRVEAHKQRLKAHLAEAEQMKKALQQQFFE